MLLKERSVVLNIESLRDLLEFRARFRGAQDLLKQRFRLNAPILTNTYEDEAIEEFCAANPSAFERDTAREQKFGFTFAPRGYLIKT